VDSKQILRILIVEDNPLDILMTERALNNLKIAYDFYVLRNGEQLLDHLSRPPDRREHVDLLLLDLNLPKRTGLEILEIMHQNPDLLRPFVAVLTTSTSPDELKKCSDLGAQIVITKPDDPDYYQETINSILKFYYEFCQKP
jgi:CheY-like chemotaxis protein